MTTLTCSDCGFDGSRWSSDDLERTLAHADDLIGYVFDGADEGFVIAVPGQPAEIGLSGVVGDVQGNRRNHGRPWQAICVYSSDVIETLREERHPIVAGGAGRTSPSRASTGRGCVGD